MNNLFRLFLGPLLAAVYFLSIPSLALAATPPHADLRSVSYTMVSYKRISKTVWDYTYQFVIQNQGDGAAIDVSAELTTTFGSPVVVVDGTVTFPDVPAGGQMTSVDTFTIRIDRTTVVHNSDLVWLFNFTDPPVPGGMVWISAGTFTMGSPDSEVDRSFVEGPQTQVTISRGFWISKFETTQEEYLAVMGSNPSFFTGDLQRPVEKVTWNDANNYCGRLTVRERAGGRLPTGYVYRLPTEAEWEYCCRAGTTTATAFGNSLSSTQANFDGNNPYGGADIGPFLETTTRVGSYFPNPWGLYDMHGNVCEWCLDYYADGLPGGSVTDPRGSTTGSTRADRGGSWLYLGKTCRSAHHSYGQIDEQYIGTGFRPVLAPGQ